MGPIILPCLIMAVFGPQSFILGLEFVRSLPLNYPAVMRMVVFLVQVTLKYMFLQTNEFKILS